MSSLIKATQTHRTMTITLDVKNYNDAENALALCLLLGGYNPLRQHSESGIPIDENVLNVLKNDFSDLLFEVKQNMKVNVITPKKL